VAFSNNDNAFSSPVYAFAYTPGILDLREKDELGSYVLNPFAGGGTKGGSKSVSDIRSAAEQ
jgi:hypothetical protein